jgi:hypothetical protein
MPGKDIPTEEDFRPIYKDWSSTLGPETWNTSTTTWTEQIPGIPKYREPKLVYIDPDLPVAYFSLASSPWGDDWDDVPYEHNAGKPYDWSVRVVYLDTDLITPRDNTVNSDYSVEMINKGAIAWLRSPSYAKHKVVISAGVTITQFVEKIKFVDGIAIVVPEPGEHTHMGDTDE